MPTTTDQGRLWQMSQRYRDELEAGNAAAADRMTRGWLEAQKRVDVEVQALLAKMEAARLAGTPPSPAWLYQQKRLATIRETIAAQVNQWAPLAEDATREAAERAVRAGERHARTLTREAARVSLPGVEATFTDLNPENLASLLGHLQPGGPMRDLLVRLGGEAADAAEAALVQGVMLGKGSDWITRQLRTALDIPRWRAETIARTEALRAYRETSRLTYRSSNVVGTWVWRAYIDRRTCAACVVMDGTEHPLEERLDGHPRCRCTMEPRTKTWGDIHPDLADLPDTRPPLGTPGKEWLAAQPDSVKLALMGPGKLRAYQAGEITLDDLVARPHSPEWGSMRRERSLMEIREGRNPNTFGPLEQSQEDILGAMVREESARNLAKETRWARWDDGRDVRVVKTPKETMARLEDDVTRARTYAAQDAAQVDDFKRLVKERQDELRAFIPDAKERAKVARKDYTLKNRKASLKAVQDMADQSADRLRQAEDALAKARTHLPDWDPDNPLKFYGDRVVAHDRSETAARWLEDLETHVGEDHHRLLRDHFAESPSGGFYVGERWAPQMDDLGHLSGHQPRGWTAGRTFDDVHGVYDPSKRVCACGHNVHGSTRSTALHEGGHALDAAYGTQGMGGIRASASDRPDWRGAMDTMGDAQKEWKPYYTRMGNPEGAYSEAWAEAFQGWTVARLRPLEEQAESIARHLMGGKTPTPEQVQAHIPLARYFRGLPRP